MFEGGCQCGALRYRVDGDILETSHCHCTMCRRMHGAAFGTYAGVRGADFQWLSETSAITRYPSSEGVVRTFCSVCGATLQALFGEQADMIYLTMGTVDGNPPHPEPFHIFTGSKAPWHEITDGCEQYEGWKDGP